MGILSSLFGAKAPKSAQELLFDKARAATASWTEEQVMMAAVVLRRRIERCDLAAAVAIGAAVAGPEGALHYARGTVPHEVSSAMQHKDEAFAWFSALVERCGKTAEEFAAIYELIIEVLPEEDYERYWFGIVNLGMPPVPHGS